MPVETIGRLYGVNGKTLSKLYKNVLSGFRGRMGIKKAERNGVPYVCFPGNCGRDPGLDETALTKGEVVTIVTNKDRKGMKGTLAALIYSVKMRDIIEVLECAIPKEIRHRVREVTTDLSGAMQSAAHEAFPYATDTIDRFHVQMLVNEAGDLLRKKAKEKAREAENDEREPARKNGVTYVPKRFTNGETPLQALNHARYAFVTPKNKWSEDQVKRVGELFGFFPSLYSGLRLIGDFRAIFNPQITPKEVTEKLKEWCQKAKEEGGKAFKTVVRTVLNNIESLLSDKSL